MKSNKQLNIKKIIGLAASAITCLQLVGCGGSQDSVSTQKEFLYVPEYQDFNNSGGDLSYIETVGDTIYYFNGIYNEEEATYTQEMNRLKIGDKEPQKVNLELGKDTNITTTVKADAEGNLRTILLTQIYEETEGNEEEETAQESTEEVAEETVTEEIGSASSSTVITSTGGAMISETTVIQGADSDYQEPISQKVELCTLSTDGSILSVIDISEIIGKDTYVQYMEIDGEGNTYLAIEQAIFVLDKEGNEICKIDFDNWISSMFATKDGTVMVAYYGQDGMEIHPVDVAQKTIGEAETNMMVSHYGNYNFGKGIDTDLIFSADNVLYSYNLGDAAPTEILNWIDCDINSDDLRYYTMLEDGRVLVVTSYWEEESSKIELTYLTKKKASEVPEKKIMVYGTMMLDYDIKKQIIKFNKTNQEYRIEVKEYMTDDYTTGLTQMNNDIIGGKCPDIIDMSQGTTEQYGSKGVLEDLYTYMDKDEEINKEDYLQNVLKAYETDGKLYAIAPRFFINTVIAKTSDVGEKKSITLDELMEIVKEMPKETALYEYATKDVILMYNTMMNMDEYVNWSTGECKFNGEEFIKALEFANNFDAEFEFEEGGPNTATRLQDGSLMMVNGSIASVRDYQIQEEMFGEPITFIGYPTNKDNGSFISGAGSVLGISTKSQYKDGAWQFIRIGITKEEQEKENKRRNWGFPITKSALEAQFKQDMEDEYYEDPQGGKHKQPKHSAMWDGFSIEIYAATEQQVEAVRDLIESVDTLYKYNEQINSIITEESAAFFEGQKNAKDVADIIQSRVQIYVNENR